MYKILATFKLSETQHNTVIFLQKLRLLQKELPNYHVNQNSNRGCYVGYSARNDPSSLYAIQKYPP